jgi:low affinity Fe/Cu permease
MKNENQVNRSEGIASHFVAAIAGFVVMMVGVGLSVTMVLLPIGIPLGLAGLGLLTWGLTPGWRK